MTNVISYKIFEAEKIKQAADIALKNKLYVSGWQLSGELKVARVNPTGNEKAVIAFDGEIPIGIIFERYGRTQAFVRKQYRKKGIAKNAIIYSGMIVKRYDEGIQGSWEFWHKVEELNCGSLN